MQCNATLEEMCTSIPIFEKPILSTTGITNRYTDIVFWYDETFDKYYLPLEI